MYGISYISYVLISNFILNLKVMWYETVYCCNFENLKLKTRITSEEKKRSYTSPSVKGKTLEYSVVHKTESSLEISISKSEKYS